MGALILGALWLSGNMPDEASRMLALPISGQVCRGGKAFRDPERRNSSTLLLLAATAKTQPQCRKWRMPVKIIAILRLLAAAITSLSRTEPPG
jgi:hypothetical protein